ncbi:hypothetical protein DL93DRAFT_2222972 [Clavulina sp. PMI_390]|nr:hypothetical protein DL93DRAFT_2222972 [Clavulina sp. PMI_390]
MKITVLSVVATFVGVTSAVPIYGQCGGIGWTGPTTCNGDLACVVNNPWWFQCLPYAEGETTAGPGFTTTMEYNYYKQ